VLAGFKTRVCVSETLDRTSNVERLSSFWLVYEFGRGK